MKTFAFHLALLCQLYLICLEGSFPHFLTSLFKKKIQSSTFFFKEGRKFINNLLPKMKASYTTSFVKNFYLLKRPPRAEVLRYSGKPILLIISPTVTSYLPDELSKLKRPGTTVKISFGSTVTVLNKIKNT